MTGRPISWTRVSLESLCLSFTKEGHTIYTGSVCQIKLSHLTAYLSVVRAKHFDLSGFNECLSLPESLRPAVDMVDPFSSRNHRVWV